MDHLNITREKSFLDPKIGTDCTFLVGAEFGDIEQDISGHRAIFANASPVFNTMFFGSVPEKGDPIKVPEIHPETFLTMVNFFYKGEIIVSMENAVELWYVADKYNIAEFLKYIPNYIIKHITPQNVLYIRKSSILFRNEFVIKKCNEIMLANISTVVNDASFLEADISTVNFIFDQQNMNVSEIDLFRALVRYENAQKSNRNDAKSEQPPSTSPAKTVSGDIKVKEQRLSSDGHSNNPCGEGSSNELGTDAQGHIEANKYNSVNNIVKKIRFLTMTPKEFTECLGMSSLIPLPEAHNILVKISNPNLCTHPMPKGYCMKWEKRKLNADLHNSKNIYCNHITQSCHSRRTIKFSNDELYEYSLDFQTNAKLQMKGVLYNLYSGRCFGTLEILNQQSDVLYQSAIDDIRKGRVYNALIFYDPVPIDPGLYFTIRVKLSKAYNAKEIIYNKYKCSKISTVDNVKVEFGRNGRSCNCEGFINSIIFTSH